VPDDYVVATGETHSVREFVATAFAYADLDYREYVKIDPQLYRPAEVELLLGDPAKARQALGWNPKVRFQDLVAEMVEADLRLLERSERAPAPRVLPGDAGRDLAHGLPA